MKTTVIYHSADYDGIFCREIARKFIPDANLIGWHFGDKPLKIPDGPIYVLDLPLDEPFGFKYKAGDKNGPQHPPGLVWIDHHKSSIESHPKSIPGYRIDGVAACRLAWQYLIRVFNGQKDGKMVLPEKEDYLARHVSEPLAVRLAGEYEVWDHRGDGDVEFQFGLDANSSLHLQTLLTQDAEIEGDVIAGHLVDEGGAAMRCYAKRDADTMRSRSFIVEFEGLKFLAITTARCNSLTFTAKDIRETGHDALMGFYYNGSKWIVSLYHAKHRTDLDLSKIAVKFGGGGHRGACGFQAEKLAFIP